MRSAVLDLTWYQYFLLDVIAVLILAVGSVLLLVLLVLKLVSKKVLSGKSRDTSSMPRRKKEN
jgi:hypothetical protein